MELIDIKNFEIIETMIPETQLLLGNSENKLIPTVIFNMDSDFLPWDYTEWVFISFFFDDLNMFWDIKKQGHSIRLNIDNKYFDEIAISILKNYKHLILSITSSTEENSKMFYLPITFGKFNFFTN